MNENRGDDAIENTTAATTTSKSRARRRFFFRFYFASRLILKISENLNEIGDENKQAAHSIIQRTSIKKETRRRKWNKIIKARAKTHGSKLKKTFFIVRDKLLLNSFLYKSFRLERTLSLGSLNIFRRLCSLSATRRWFTNILRFFFVSAKQSPISTADALRMEMNSIHKETWICFFASLNIFEEFRNLFPKYWINSFRSLMFFNKPPRTRNDMDIQSMLYEFPILGASFVTAEIERGIRWETCTETEIALLTSIHFY